MYIKFHDIPKHVHQWSFAWFYRLKPLNTFFEHLNNFTLIWRRHKFWWKAAKSALRAFEQGGIFISCHTCCGFSGLIRMTAQFNGIVRFARRCAGHILTRIFTAIWSFGFSILKMYLLRVSRHLKYPSAFKIYSRGKWKQNRNKRLFSYLAFIFQHSKQDLVIP
jgi:hypothetical protein